MSLNERTQRLLVVQRETNRILTETMDQLAGMVPDPITDSMPVDRSITSTLQQLHWEIERGTQLAASLQEYVAGPQAQTSELDTKYGYGSSSSPAELASRGFSGIASAEYFDRHR